MNLVERYCSECGAACSEKDPACVACGASLKVTKQLDEKVIPPPPSLRLATHLQTLQLFQERYRIVRQVGVGGFGAVYEAMDTWETHKVAIKEIGLAGLNAQQVIEATGAFNREVQMLSSLRHAGIPLMFEQLTDADHWYLVMEFIAGKTLEEIQAQAAYGRMPLERVLSIGVQVCTVLEYLHSQQPAVIFRDIKPANIMLTPGGNLYLIDFGVARRYQRTKTRDTIAFGSPGYAPPEQYGRAQTTPLADIYSLGALLYCLLSGDDPSEHPFTFPPLRRYGVDGIRELDALIQRMVASDPVQRPQKAGMELRRIQQLYYQNTRRSAPIWIPPRGQTPPMLTAIMGSGQRRQQQQMVSAPAIPGPQQQPARKKVSRRSVLAGSLVGGGTLLTLGIVVAWKSSLTHQALTITHPGSPNGNATPGAQNAVAMTPTRAEHPLMPAGDGTYWSADLSSAVVVYMTRNTLDVYSVHTRKLLSNIAMSSLYDVHIQWSSDNSKIFYIPDNSVWNVKTGRKLYTLSSSDQWGLQGSIAWSPNGKYIIGSVYDYSPQVKVGIFDAKHGKTLFQATFPGTDIANCIAWSPDSRYVAFPDTDSANWTIGNPWSVVIMDVTTFKRVGTLSDTVLPGANMNASSFVSTSGIAWSPDGMTIAIAINDHAWLYTLAHDSNGWHVEDKLLIDIPLYAVPLWSPSSRYLASFSHIGLSVHDTTTGKKIAFSNSNPPGSIAAMAWSADSQSITGADDNNALWTWTLPQ